MLKFDEWVILNESVQVFLQSRIVVVVANGMALLTPGEDGRDKLFGRTHAQHRKPQASCPFVSGLLLLFLVLSSNSPPPKSPREPVFRRETNVSK